MKKKCNSWFLLLFALLVLIGCQILKPSPTSQVPVKEPKLAVLNPRAYMPEVKLVPLAPRKPDLNNKVVYIINSWPTGSELEGILKNAADYLVKHYPTVEIITKDKPSPPMTDDPELWDEMVKKADAFIYGTAPSGGTTAWAITWGARLEKRGLPGAAIMFDTFIEDAEATCARVGTPFRWVSVPYPPQTITNNKMSEIMEKIFLALTKPLSEKEKATGSSLPPRPQRIAMEGTLGEIEEYFYKRGWTDGLPIIPPTEERLAEMLRGTSHAPNEVVTNTMWPEKWQVTVEKVAINGVMAGCRPEYMPVLLASVEAFSFADYASSVGSTNSFSFMEVLNGPIRKEIGMNSGLYALGPGNQANAAIGRALRLFITNLGGGIPGVNIMGNQGNVSAYTFCFAENEEASPWDSFAVEQGYKPKQSTVTIFAGGWSHVGNYIAGSLDYLSKAVARFEWPNGIVLLVSPPRARLLAKQGLSKEDVKQYIWSHATLSMKEFKADIFYKQFIEPIMKGKEMYGQKYLWPKEYLGLPDDAVVSVYPRKYMYVIVVGGETNPMMQGWKMAYPSTVSIDKWK